MTKFSDHNIRAIGIAWIRKEDYAACLLVFEDGREFFDTWEQWVEGAQKGEAEFKADGHIVERVYIDPHTFPSWCRSEGVGTGREGRTRFAADFVAKKYRNQS